MLGRIECENKSEREIEPNPLSEGRKRESFQSIFFQYNYLFSQYFSFTENKGRFEGGHASSPEGDGRAKEKE